MMARTLDYEKVYKLHEGTKQKPGMKVKDLARLFKTNPQNIYNALSRHKRKLNGNGTLPTRPARRQFIRHAVEVSAGSGLVSSEMDSLRKKRDKIDQALSLLEQIED